MQALLILGSSGDGEREIPFGRGRSLPEPALSVGAIAIPLRIAGLAPPRRDTTGASLRRVAGLAPRVARRRVGARARFSATEGGHHTPPTCACAESADLERHDRGPDLDARASARAARPARAPGRPARHRPDSFDLVAGACNREPAGSSSSTEGLPAPATSSSILAPSSPRARDHASGLRRRDRLRETGCSPPRPWSRAGDALMPEYGCATRTFRAARRRLRPTIADITASRACLTSSGPSSPFRLPARCRIRASRARRTGISSTSLPRAASALHLAGSAPVKVPELRAPLPPPLPRPELEAAGGGSPGTPGECYTSALRTALRPVAPAPRPAGSAAATSSCARTRRVAGITRAARGGTRPGMALGQPADAREFEPHPRYLDSASGPKPREAPLSLEARRQGLSRPRTTSLLFAPSRASWLPGQGPMQPRRPRKIPPKPSTGRRGGKQAAGASNVEPRP